MYFFFSLALIIFSIIPFRDGVRHLIRARRSKRFTGQTTAEILEVEETIQTVKGQRRYHYKPTFCYQVGGRKYCQVYPITSSSPDRYKVRGHVELRYYEEDPSQYVLAEGHAFLWAGISGVTMGLLGVGVGIYVLLN